MYGVFFVPSMHLMQRILLTSGGTLGPVAPLLAIGEMAKSNEMDVVGFIGTAHGPERAFVASLGIPFFSVCAGKWRRYWDLRNILAPFITLLGVAQVYGLLAKLKPDVVVSGGSFVGVPVIIAARLRGVKTIVHQQDVLPSLANRIVARWADTITVTFPETAVVFPKEKTVVTGNPVRPSILRGDRERAIRRLELESETPTLFVFGGGTGAQALNDLIERALPKLVTFCQIVHATGKGKLHPTPYTLHPKNRYHPIEIFAETMPDVYAAADLVLARAGIGTITELSALWKPAIIVPIPHSHQEQNAALLERTHSAEVYLQSELTPDRLVALVRALVVDNDRRKMLGKNISSLNPPDALQAMFRVIRGLAK